MKDYFGYQNKNVVVTGASSGMGKATAEMLVDLGAKVYALDWNECDVKRNKTICTCRFIKERIYRSSDERVA